MSDIRPGRRAGAIRDPLVAADGIYATLVAAQRVAGDIPLCQALEQLAAGTGQNKYRHVAQILRGKTLGRTAIDDREALRRIRETPPDRRAAAASKVARSIAGAEADVRTVEAIAQRLRKKLREEKRTNLLRSAGGLSTDGESGGQR